jgi:hypothetical protein
MSSLFASKQRPRGNLVEKESSVLFSISVNRNFCCGSVFFPRMLMILVENWPGERIDG